jgi:hypothetical protein
MSTEKHHLDQIKLLALWILLNHMFFSCGGCETARVSSHVIIAQQVVGKPVGMCKANQQQGLKLSIVFNQLVKILLAVTRCK